VALQLLAFSTGADEFVDRDAVERIVDEGRTNGHPVRAMIHAVVQSDLFRCSLTLAPLNLGYAADLEGGRLRPECGPHRARHRYVLGLQSFRERR